MENIKIWHKNKKKRRYKIFQYRKYTVFRVVFLCFPENRVGFPSTYGKSFPDELSAF